ncbi:FAD-binding oxidoreductase [Arthrobacter sp. JSM 101049]|uniref:FAD-binding oxidoreductase n=1 Tax=Arthrobacter sp. JSM 101049 TaxID=929097 RepID=UPI0035626109
MTTTLESNADDLRSHVRGAVRLASEGGFDAACRGFNLARQHRPEMVVVAASDDDIVVAVRHAARHDLRVHVHATAHGIGVPADGGLLINTSMLQDLSVDAERRTARVSAGVRWHQVIEAAAGHGLAPLNGSSPTVGVVGYTLGCGLGPMGRTFGFAADHVRGAQLVTAAGELLEVDADSNPELFWALRGGKCEVGIVTGLEFDLMPVRDVLGGAVFFPGDAAPVLLHAYAGWAATLPENTTTSIALLRMPDAEAIPASLRGRLSVHLRFVHVGSDTEGQALLAPMLGLCDPLGDMVGRMPYAAIGSVHQDPLDPSPVWDASTLVDGLPAEAIDALLATAGPDVEVPLLLAEIRQLGGALSRQPEQANAIGGRDAAFSVYVVGPDLPELHDVVESAGKAVLAAMEPWSTGHTQINFAGSDTTPESVRRAWSAESTQRLRTVKRAMDPDGRFRFAFSID